MTTVYSDVNVSNGIRSYKKLECHTYVAIQYFSFNHHNIGTQKPIATYRYTYTEQSILICKLCITVDGCKTYTLL